MTVSVKSIFYVSLVTLNFLTNTCCNYDSSRISFNENLCDESDKSDTSIDVTTVV